MRVSPRSLRPLRLGWVGPCGVFEHGDAALEIAPVGPGSLLDRILSYRTLPKTQLQLPIPLSMTRSWGCRFSPVAKVWLPASASHG